ncbi:CpaF family protein [Microaerobacter geothermalis]|uniref:CpaF family protein n=1 Tax=Microaerobacter geothermalis TaxID=674972 RepID=UPI001F28369F|nr:CpaF family protein [Microaerobacter geothermalis]MCF6094186.1 CpaF family protein [Microaerobacter geothermalis]
MSLLKRMEKEKKLEGSRMSKSVVTKSAIEKKIDFNQYHDPYAEIKMKIHRLLVEELGKDDLDEGAESEKQMIDLIERFLSQDDKLWSKAETEQITQELLAEIRGYGPIDSLLKDPEISEVMVNHPHQVFIERKGKLEQVPVRFRDHEHVMRIIEKIVSPLGRRIDESSPMVDARLPDGSRVNAIIPPLALKGPCITIRKFSKDPFTISDLISFQTLTPMMSYFLEACVKARLNIVVSGGTGSGKTTTLNVLSSFIPSNERIVTIEDAAELQLRQEHVVTLETRPANVEGKGEITIRDLVKNSLRMRPDRIVVGEVRSGEALDMLQAMNTGHDGSLTTGHANSPRDMLSRLETMVLMAGMDLPIKAIREQISSAINLIVQQNRLKDGSRKITQITEVLGMEGEVITMQDLFIYSQGEFRATGIIPKCFEKIKDLGIPISTEWFQ